MCFLCPESSYWYPQTPLIWPYYTFLLCFCVSRTECSPSHIKHASHVQVSTQRSSSLQSGSGYTTGYASYSDEASVPTSPEVGERPGESAQLEGAAPSNFGQRPVAVMSKLQPRVGSTRDKSRERTDEADTQSGATGQNRPGKTSASLSSLLRDGQHFMSRGKSTPEDEDDITPKGILRSRPDYSSGTSTLPSLRKLQARSRNATGSNAMDRGNTVSFSHLPQGSGASSMTCLPAASSQRHLSGHGLGSSMMSSFFPAAGDFQELKVISQSLANLRQIQQSIADLTAGTEVGPN